jgi:DNA polymerase III subunit gamma/tau
MKLLARAADGSMRDALSLLDQAIAYGGGQVTEDEVRAMLGTAPAGGWPALIEAMNLRGMVRQLAENCTLAEQTGQLVHLRLDPAHAHLHSAALEKKLAEAVNTQFGRPMKLRIDVEAAGEETPAQRQTRLTRERQQAAERAIAEDDNIRNLEETFGAQVQRDSVRPLE